VVFSDKKDRNQKNTVHETQSEIEFFKHFESPCAFYSIMFLRLVNHLVGKGVPLKEYINILYKSRIICKTEAPNGKRYREGRDWASKTQK
jgi:hypothetical protein